jgi:hypothetical protein
VTEEPSAGGEPSAMAESSGKRILLTEAFSITGSQYGIDGGTVANV